MSAREPAGPNAAAVSGRDDRELDAAHETIEDLRSQVGSLQSSVTREQRRSRRDEKRQAALERRLARAEARIVELERSASYRIGHAIVVALKSPLLGLRWLWIAIVRLLARIVPEEARRWIAERTPERWRARIRRATRPRGSRTTAASTLATRRRTAEPEQETVVEGVLDAVRGDAPLFVLVLTPSPDADVRGLLGVIRTLRASAEFVPVLVTQSDDFLPYREGGVAFEYIPSLTDWLEAGLPGSWHEYFDRRIAEIVSVYDADDLLLVPSAREGLAAVQDVLASIIVRDALS